jgi:hypothetical protein
MENYYVNTKTNVRGNTEVHNSDCNNLPGKNQLYDLGLHLTCTSAVLKAKSVGFIFSNGCKHCIKECYSHSNIKEGMIY